VGYAADVWNHTLDRRSSAIDNVLMLPLESITVIALEQAVAAPLASRHLADLGARVIKIERPVTGDFARHYDATVKGMASHFVWLNRSKESLTLDLKRADAKEILRLLLARSDVFLHNLAPGAVARLGFDTAGLRRKHPRLIICEITGYGSSGPYRDKKAYDLLVQSEAGVLSVTGTEETPSKAGIAIADIAGGMYAFSGILTALLTRERSGEGGAMEVSLFDALGEWMGYPAYYAAYGGSAPSRTGAHHPAIAPYGPFAAGDGKPVYIGIQNEREWQRFCEFVLRRPELASDPQFHSNTARLANRAALETIIQGGFRNYSADQILDQLDQAGIANARMNTVEEFLDHPQLKARDRWREAGSPVGPLRALLPPVTLEGVDPVLNPIPDVGQHTDAILTELGYTAEAIAAWRQAGVI
jgi:itaconate CoA-transferase